MTPAMPSDAVGLDSDDLAEFARGVVSTVPPSLRVAFDPENVRNGLGKLVLTLVELIRELLERQAIRRMEAGSLTDAEIERVGTTFLRLSEQVEDLKRVFGIEGEELNMDLGPLGKLL